MSSENKKPTAGCLLKHNAEHTYPTLTDKEDSESGELKAGKI